MLTLHVQAAASTGLPPQDLRCKREFTLPRLGYGRYSCMRITSAAARVRTP
jgi:hypothetical protein